MTLQHIAGSSEAEGLSGQSDQNHCRKYPEHPVKQLYVVDISSVKREIPKFGTIFIS